MTAVVDWINLKPNWADPSVWLPTVFSSAFATHIDATTSAAAAATGQSANCSLIDPLIMNYWFFADMSAEHGINTKVQELATLWQLHFY